MYKWAAAHIRYNSLSAERPPTSSSTILGACLMALLCYCMGDRQFIQPVTGTALCWHPCLHGQHCHCWLCMIICCSTMLQTSVLLTLLKALHFCFAALQCELGATASSASDGNLTSAILACPPTSCLGSNCPGKIHSLTYSCCLPEAKC